MRRADRRRIGEHEGLSVGDPAPRAARRAVVVVTDVATGAQRLVKTGQVVADPLRDVIEKHIRSGKSGMEETTEGKVFLTVYVPPPRLIIVGAVHIAQTLAPMAAMLEFDVTVVDPRGEAARIAATQAQGVPPAAGGPTPVIERRTRAPLEGLFDGIFPLF